MSARLARRTAAISIAGLTALGSISLAEATASAHPHAKQHTTLSIRVARGAINPGGGDIVRGDLQARGHHNAGRRIVLRAHPQGATSWTDLQRHRTARHGQVAFQVSPDVTTRYQLVFRGNKRQQASHSGVVTVRVLDTTSLVVSTASKSIDPGQTDTVNGALSLDGSPLAGQTIRLLGATRHHKLALMGTQVTDTSGDVSFSVTPPSTSRYQLVFRGTADNHGARSAVTVIRVRQQSSLSIRARAHNGNEIISGVLRGGSHALRHHKVTLQSRPSGTTTWQNVATHRTGRRGFINFTIAAPTQSTDYQLVFGGGPVYDGCQSGVVTVTVS
jgi:hypothetical protein